MTTDEARIVLLEHALRQAQSTVEFLHGCLTDDHYRYTYPEQTAEDLARWAALAPRGPGCLHSRLRVEDCESCRLHAERASLLAEAKKTLRGT